ncbi:hypothetical protein [Streptomyces sp. NPDC001980]|uniref:hypothetical protein n=1 Tax=Streptomyces sp. NPDC001980 TaxID=3157126 RepID=UPI0033250329
MLGRTPARPTASPTTRYARGVAAAVIAVAALITAANAGPARATDDSPVSPTSATAGHTAGH